MCQDPENSNAHYRSGSKNRAALLRVGPTVWHDAAMPRHKKKISKFDKAALAVAEGIANIPLEGQKRAVELLQDIENRPEEPERTKKLSAKIRKEVKKKASGLKRKTRKKK
jgi:hypothetical protein